MKTIRNYLILLVLSLFSLTVNAAPVNINTADADTLASNIKGVGVKKAQAIIHYRKTHGDFKRVDDIVKVKGIGTKLLEQNRADLMVTTPKIQKN